MSDFKSGEPALESNVPVNHVPLIHGDPMTPERLLEFMKEIRREQDITPFMRFTERAKASGFNEMQAQFLWDLHLMPTPRF